MAHSSKKRPSFDKTDKFRSSNDINDAWELVNELNQLIARGQKADPRYAEGYLKIEDVMHLCITVAHNVRRLIKEEGELTDFTRKKVGNWLNIFRDESILQHFPNNNKYG